MQGSALSAGRAAWYIACLLLSLGAAVSAGLLGPCLDWSMLEIGVLCLMPALLVLDVGAMCVHGWAWIRLGRQNMRSACRISPQPRSASHMCGAGSTRISVSFQVLM